MAGRTTRNKIRFQVKSAKELLKEAQVSIDKAQEKLAGSAILADNRSEHINKTLPVIMAGLNEVQKALDRFYEGL